MNKQRPDTSVGDLSRHSRFQIQNKTVRTKMCFSEEMRGTLNRMELRLLLFLIVAFRRVFFFSQVN